ncbi:MAG TPA: AMP-binding protein [Blastocatellia bacterium]|nr:AMP-binding protein [Blastocatellia bacterium]
MATYDPTPHLKRFVTYEEAARSFQWRIPEKFNIATAVCGKHPDGATRIALIDVKPGGASTYTFAGIDFLSDKFATVLRAAGIGQGDRVAVILPQSASLPIAHLAILKLGAIVVPLTTLFGAAALEFRLRDSGAKAAVLDHSTLERLESVAGNLDNLRILFVDDGQSGELHEEVARKSVNELRSFWREVTEASSELNAPGDASTDDTDSSAPAFILYTSGSTGDPKGAVHCHRFLIGHLTAIEMCYNFDFAADTVFWTPADWAWVGALFDLLYPAWYYGRPVIAYRQPKFNASATFGVLERFNVTNVFIPPTALRLMKMEEPWPRSRFTLKLRNIFSGGEPLTPEIHQWAGEALGASINEGYGQTEANMLVSNCQRWFPAKIGSMGRAAPGHTIEIIDDGGNVLAPGKTGHIALRAPDPVLFLGYLNASGKTSAAFIGNWLNTGDTGWKDEDGYFWFQGREDDLIKTAAYRIGPAEIERVILGHPSIAECAVVGVPDEIRGTIIKAFIRLIPGVAPDKELITELQAMVSGQVGRHAYPREIEIVDSLPTTTTGKVKRKQLRELNTRTASEGKPADSI